MKYYTIGEIYRDGLLKNHKGEAYAHKATISKIVNKLEFSVIETPWGQAKAISKDQINQHNKNIRYQS